MDEDSKNKGKGVLPLANNAISLPVKEKLAGGTASGACEMPPDLGPFENVFELPDVGIIGGDISENANAPKPLVKIEPCLEMMTGVTPSYAYGSGAENNPSFGLGVKNVNTGQVYGGVSESFDYSSYLNNMPQLNYVGPSGNENSGESFASYQKRVGEVTTSLHEAEGMLAIVRAMNGSLQTTVNSLHSENETLKPHYSIECAGYTNMSGDLARAKELESNLSKKVLVLEQEKMALRRDLDWVMRKGIPRMLAKVFRSDQFDGEMSKVQKVMVAHGHELGRQEARTLYMSKQRVPGCDPNIPRRVKEAVRGLKKNKWECMEAIISAPDLSPDLLRGALERGDGAAGEGSSSRPIA